RCIPGCESLVRAEDGSLEAVVVTRIGPVSARFKGKVTLEDVTPPSGYRLVFAGQGGAAGFAKGEAKVQLIPESATSTELRYTADAAVGGKLAQVGSRLIESSAKKLAEEFFTRFEAGLSAPAEPAGEAGGSVEANDSAGGSGSTGGNGSSGARAGAGAKVAAAVAGGRAMQGGRSTQPKSTSYALIGAVAIVAIAAIAFYLS